MDVGLEGRYGRMGWMLVMKDEMDVGLKGWDECRFERMG